ncbi:hypothetical protein BD779DRAFT_1675768 [Infundibulicybe gibba]|nr:hypothetical protein BD779DRAFT_1675768 [Infundibulicybe gibba]
MATRHIVVDDNSAGQIRYTGNWSSATGEKSQYGNSHPFQNTLHTTVEAASSFSFSFIVNVTKPGAGFWFDNLIYAPPSNVSFESATLRVNRFDRGIIYGSGWSSLGGFANFTQETGSILKFDFFGSSLSWTGCIPKQLAIAPSFDQTPLTLNFLDIFDASSGSLSTPPNTSPSPLVTQSPAPHQRGLATGTIIGVVVGVICTAVFILIVALLCRRRSHYSPRDDILPTQVRSTTDITPFTSAPVLRPIETSEIRISKSFSSPSIGDHSPIESHQTFNDDATEPALLSAVDMHREQISPNHKPLPMRFYQDSGVRMSPASRDFVDVPPSYTPR